MKKILFLFAILISFSVSFGQSLTSPTPGVTTGQMLNTSNTHPSQTNDTLTDAGTLYLSITQWTTAVSTTRLPALYPLYGSGTLSIIINGVKITGTPAGTVSLEESTDGVHWAQVRLSVMPIIATADTAYVYTFYDLLTIANVSTTQSLSWNLATKPVPYYRLKIAGSGTQTSSWKAWFYFTTA